MNYTGQYNVGKPEYFKYIWRARIIGVLIGILVLAFFGGVIYSFLVKQGVL